MTSFNAADNGTGAADPTKVADPQDSSTSVNTPNDSEAVIEVNGRKYTKAELAKKISNADQFIETLKAERAEDRTLLEQVKEQLKKQVDVAEVLKSIREGKPAEEPATSVVQQTIDPNAIASQVLETINTAKKEAEKESNFKSVSATLTAVFGDKVNSVVQARASELGMTVEEAAQFARERPKAFLQFFPEAQKVAKPSVLSSGTFNNAPSFNRPENKPVHWDGLKSKDAVAVYLARLKELSEG